MTHRKQQIESTLQRAITDVLSRRLSDPRLEGSLVSVTSVCLTEDLQHASVLISVVPQRRQYLVHTALQHAAGRVASELRKTVALRVLPHLQFKLDPTLKNQDRVYDALKEARDRRPAAGAPTAAPSTADAPSGQETAS